MQFDVFSHHLSIDEEMVPYFGRHASKMFIKTKPVRFGYKFWCICSSNGNLYKCIPCGRKSMNSEETNYFVYCEIKVFTPREQHLKIVYVIKL